MGRTNEANYVMVRVKRETHRDLVALAERWQKAGEAGIAGVPYSADSDRPALSDVIAELIRREFDHQKRRHQSRARKALRDARPEASGPEDE